jgi:hypothetical protein
VVIIVDNIDHIDMNSYRQGTRGLGGTEMSYMKCDGCGEYAMAVLKSDTGERPVCLDCLDDPKHEGASRQYVCSVAGCKNSPEFLATLENQEWRSFLVCEMHFNHVKNDISSFLSIPLWLTNGKDISASEEGVVIEIEFGQDMR